MNPEVKTPRYKRLARLGLKIGTVSMWTCLIMQWSFAHINVYMAVVGLGLTGYGTILILMIMYLGGDLFKQD